MIESIISWLTVFAHNTSLPIFVLVGGVVEEIVAPIPSPLVATLAGSILATQNASWPMVLWICLLATIGKTTGATIFYILGYKFEDWTITYANKYIGVSHEDIENFSKRFSKKQKNTWLLLSIRAIPMMPSTPISLVCGILKMPLKVFLFASLGGFYIREFIFIYIGYAGLQTVDSLMNGLDTGETIMKAIIVIGGIGLLGYLYYKRSRGKTVSWIKK